MLAGFSVGEVAWQFLHFFYIIPNCNIAITGPNRIMKYWEYDCLVVTPHALYHIENKDWAGNLKGDDYAWFRNGQEVANLHLFCNNNHGGTVVAGYFTINHTAQLNNLDQKST